MTSFSQRDVRVIVVDDQDLVRAGLQRVLRRRDGFLIVAECTKSCLSEFSA